MRHVAVLVFLAVAVLAKKGSEKKDEPTSEEKAQWGPSMWARYNGELDEPEPFSCRVFNRKSAPTNEECPDAKACVTYTLTYPNGKTFYSANCSNVACPEVDKHFNDLVKSGKVKNVHYQCCNERICNLHGDKKRLGVEDDTTPPTTVTASPRSDWPNNRQLGCLVYDREGNYTYKTLCSLDSSMSCITFESLLNTGKHYFSAECSNQTCEEFERQQLKSKQLRQVDYKCCTTNQCNGANDGFRLTSTDFEKPKPAKIKTVNGDWLFAKLAPEDIEKPKHPEPLLCYAYDHVHYNFSWAFECEHFERTSCVVYSAKQAHGKPFFDASCTRLTCDKFEETLKIAIRKGKYTEVEYKCCNESGCNRHPDGFRITKANLTPQTLPKVVEAHGSGGLPPKNSP